MAGGGRKEGKPAWGVATEEANFEIPAGKKGYRQLLSSYLGNYLNIFCVYGYCVQSSLRLPSGATGEHPFSMQACKTDNAALVYLSIILSKTHSNRCIVIINAFLMRRIPL